MFAKGGYNYSITHSLYYHESKVKQGKAECILAENFLKDRERLSREDKLYYFKRLNVLNDVTKANTLHVSLSFHPSDRLDNKLMCEVARKYMGMLHLDHQPWLAYRHYDAGHPHMHIVSVLIQHNGDRLPLDDFLRFESRKVAAEIERQYPIVQFYGQHPLPKKPFDLTPPLRVVYGQPMRKHSVEHVLHHVINKFAFTSLSEYNAILGLYNIKSKIAWEDQAKTKPKGLVYYTLDEKGHAIGISFNSSSFETKPTLKKLEQQFILNQTLHQQKLQRVKTYILWTLKKPVDWETFCKKMRQEQIYAIPEKDKEGKSRNIRFVDMSSKCAYDGEAIGGQFTAESIGSRLISEEEMRLGEEEKQTERQRMRIDL